MQVFRGLPPAADVPIALTIGNFDGVHRGHQAMLSRLVEAADDLALPPAVLTFDPPPREFFAQATRAAAAVVAARQARAVRRARRRPHLRRALRRTARLARRRRRSSTPCSCAGSARAGCWWARTSASARAARATSRRCAAPRGRSASRRCAPWRSTASARRRRPCARRWRHGDLARATRAARAAVRDLGPRRARREARAQPGLSDGEPAAASASRRSPASSPCACTGSAARRAPASASVGVRPTVTAAGVPLLEVFIFDFDAPIYGRRIGVEFLHKLRDEERYPDLDALTRQIERDVAQARDYFSTACAAAALTPSRTPPTKEPTPACPTTPKIDYKTTLNLPDTPFPMRGDLAKREPRLGQGVAAERRSTRRSAPRRRAARASCCTTARRTRTTTSTSATRSTRS